MLLRGRGNRMISGRTSRAECAAGQATRKTPEPSGRWWSGLAASQGGAGGCLRHGSPAAPELTLVLAGGRGSRFIVW